MGRSSISPSRFALLGDDDRDAPVDLKALKEGHWLLRVISDRARFDASWTEGLWFTAVATDFPLALPPEKRIPHEIEVSLVKNGPRVPGTAEVVNPPKTVVIKIPPPEGEGQEATTYQRMAGLERHHKVWVYRRREGS